MQTVLKFKIAEQQALFRHARKHKNYQNAFEYLRKGNLLKSTMLGKKNKQEAVVHARLKSTFPMSFPKYKKAPFTPIFIVGMPRSGTSITEQIISNHSQVNAGGELKTLADAVLKITQPVDANILTQVRNEYFKKTESIGNKYITDKMPLNFRWIGFIATCFPEAKIIYCDKNAMEICWENYRIDWEEDGHEYSYDLQELGQFYTMHVTLMKYWKNIYKDRIFTMNYNNLVSDSYTTITKLFAYLEMFPEELTGITRTEA